MNVLADHGIYTMVECWCGDNSRCCCTQTDKHRWSDAPRGKESVRWKIHPATTENSITSAVPLLSHLLCTLCYDSVNLAYPTDLFNLNFQSLEVVSRYRDPQLRVTENLCYLWNLGPNNVLNWKHILLSTTVYTGANKNTECLLYDISVLKLNIITSPSRHETLSHSCFNEH